MSIPNKVLLMLDSTLDRWDKEIGLKTITPKYGEILNEVLKEANLVYETSGIELKDIEVLRKNREKTKSRWFKSQKKDKLSLSDFNKLGEWAETEERLIKFPFISSRKGKSLTTAVKNDILIELYTLILNVEETKDEDLKKGEKREISSVPNMLVSIPCSTAKNGRFEDIGRILSELGHEVATSPKSIETKSYSFTITFDDDEPKTSLQLKNPQNIKKAINKIAQFINATDRKIFNYIISRSGAEFINNGRIRNIAIKDIIKNVFEVDAGDNYIAIKASIFKMERIAGHIGNKKSVASVGLISHFEFTTENGTDFLMVDIHPYIKDEIIKKQTINLYKDIIDTCPDDDSELILYFLQRKRLALTLAKKNLTITVNWFDYFSEAIIFTNKRKDRNIARLVKALQFVQETESVLDYFIRRRDEITLAFKEMTEDELKDLNYDDIFDEKFAEFRNKLIDEPEYTVH